MVITRVSTISAARQYVAKETLAPVKPGGKNYSTEADEPVVVELSRHRAPSAPRTNKPDNAPQPPSADFDGNGIIDGSDLGYLLGKFGTIDKKFDLDGNGAIDLEDLSLLLSQWGKVPEKKTEQVTAKKPDEFNPDYNQDGDLNIMDFLAYQNSYVRGERRADVNGDGKIDAKDFYAYRDAFLKYRE